MPLFTPQNLQSVTQVGSSTTVQCDFQDSTFFGELAIFNSDLLLLAGMELNRNTHNASGTLIDNSIYNAATVAGITLTLPTAALKPGKIYIIKDESGNALISNITINTEGPETIDGQASVTINTNYGVKRVIANSSNWFCW